MKKKKAVKKSNTKSTEQLIAQLVDAVIGLGWTIAVPGGSDTVPGMFIGRKEYVESMLKKISKKGKGCQCQKATKR